jgi:dihydroflavonol-4-reductase
MAKYFITGGTGFVGRHLLQKISNDENEINCLCRSEGKLPSDRDSVRWVKGDLLDTPSYKEALEETDYVIHLAGLLSARRREDYDRVNVKGTTALLDACRETGIPLKRFIHMSSIAVMGSNSEGKLLNETDACTPRSEYGKSKYQAEKAVLSYAKYFPVVILRPTFVYGPGDLRGLKFLQSLNNPSSLLLAAPIKTICLLHVADVIKACWLAVQKSIQTGEIFIISNPEISTFEEVWIALDSVLHDILGQRLIPKDQQMPFFRESASKIATEVFRKKRYQYWACDTSKARSILGFRPETPFKKGAFDTILWYIEQGYVGIDDIKKILAGTKKNERAT